jgi:hypothetical protein
MDSLITDYPLACGIVIGLVYIFVGYYTIHVWRSRSW